MHGATMKIFNSDVTNTQVLNIKTSIIIELKGSFCFHKMFSYTIETIFYYCIFIQMAMRYRQSLS